MRHGVRHQPRFCMEEWAGDSPKRGEIPEYSTNHGTSALWSGNGVQVVAGSDPVAPTIQSNHDGRLDCRLRSLDQIDQGHCRGLYETAKLRRPAPRRASGGRNPEKRDFTQELPSPNPRSGTWSVVEINGVKGGAPQGPDGRSSGTQSSCSHGTMASIRSWTSSGGQSKISVVPPHVPPLPSW